MNKLNIKRDVIEHLRLIEERHLRGELISIREFYEFQRELLKKYEIKRPQLAHILRTLFRNESLKKIFLEGLYKKSSDVCISLSFYLMSRYGLTTKEVIAI